MNSNDVSETQDFKKKSPRRFGVHFYFKVACIVYVLITLVAFRYWERSISSYLESVMAEVEDEGGLLDLTQLKPPVIDDEDNAVWWYDLADSKDPFVFVIGPPEEYADFEDGSQHVFTASDKRLFKLSEMWYRMQSRSGRVCDVVRQYPDISREFCDLFSEMAECIHRGGECEASNWGYVFVPLKQWTVTRPFARRSMLRELGRRMIFMVQVEAKAGNTATALEHIYAVFAMSRHLDDVYLLVQNMDSLSFDALASNVINNVACSLEVDTEEKRQAVLNMITYLHTGELRDSYEHCVIAQRGQLYVMLQDMEYLENENSILKYAGPLGARAMASLSVANAILFCSRCMREVDEEFYDRVKLAELRKSYNGMGFDTVFFSADSIFSIWAITERISISRRLAAISLMLRLYEVDHGDLPDSLEELEGEYIAKLPIDPFSPSKSGFRYVRDGNRARIYSVDEDGKDGGGNTNEYGDHIVEYRPEPEDLSDLFEGLEAP